MDSDALLQTLEFSKFPVIFSNDTSPVAFWSQHEKDNLSGFDWLTLNWSKMCFVTRSSCPRGLARFPKLFPHHFSSHSRKKKHCFAKNQITSILKKDCSWLGIFNPREFIRGLISAKTHIHVACCISNWPPAQEAKLSNIITSVSIPQGCRPWVSVDWR